MSETNPLAALNYLKIFFKQKHWIFIPAMIGLCLGICTGLFMPKQYQSSTVLLVEEGKTDNPLFNQLAVSTTVKERIATIRESMLGWNSMIKLIKRLKMDRTIQTPQELEGLIMSIRERISIDLRSRNIIDLSYFGDTPEETQSVVKNITEIFIERNIDVQNQETSDAITFIEEQLKLYEARIKSSEISRLKDQLEAFLGSATELHPQVIQLREMIAQKEQELKDKKLEYYEDEYLDPGTMNPIIDQIRKALDGIDSPTVSLGTDGSNSLYQQLNSPDNLVVSARDADVNQNIYSMLLQRLETAKITQRLQSSKEGTKYVVLDPPRLPLKPIKPNKPLIAVVGLVMGIIIGVGVILMMQFLDQSFIDVEEAKEYFGRPLLGAISKIETQDNIRARQGKVIILYSVVIVLCVVVVLMSFAISNFHG